MTPMPVPAPHADMRAYLQSAIDGGSPLPAGLYLYDGSLTITQHGGRLAGVTLPSRQNAGSRGGGYGVVLRQTAGVGPALIIGTPGAYISNVEVARVRIETAGNECIRAFNPATSILRDLSLIGTRGAPGRAVLHVSGGIQLCVLNVEACGMGYPEWEPHGDFSQRADGMLFENGIDENGLPTTYTAHRVEGCYIHMCPRAVVNESGIVRVGGMTVVEECLRVIHTGDTGRTYVDGLYWESVEQTPFYLGDYAVFSASQLEGGAAVAPCFFDGKPGGQGILGLSLLGGYFKGTAPLMGANLRRLDNGPIQGFAAVAAHCLPAGMDKGWASLIGPDTRGAGR